MNRSHPRRATDVVAESSRQFAMFATVGAIGTAAHYALLTWLHTRCGWQVVAASSAGATLGAIVNYILNARITFQGARLGVTSAGRFMAVAAISLMLNGLVMQVLESTAPGVHYLLRQIGATFTVLLFSYVANKHWTFRNERSH